MWSSHLGRTALNLVGAENRVTVPDARISPRTSAFPHLCKDGGADVQQAYRGLSGVQRSRPPGISRSARLLAAG
jgi:hypothetical protein